MRTTDHPLPKLVTFDGQARSGKGTIARLVKDYIRDEMGVKVMLIDAGQVFRVLVITMQEAGVDLDDPAQIDAYLADPAQLAYCTTRVKEVYRMEKSAREALLYSPDIGVNSAKVGARPLSQQFKDDLLRKWLTDARNEGFAVVLLDGRALEETGTMLAQEGLCEYVLELFFVCDPIVSAQRTLGMMPKPYDTLDSLARQRVDELAEQIVARNHADSVRTVQPVVSPAGTRSYLVSELPDHLDPRISCPAVVIDRSIELPADEMAVPVIRLVARYIV